MQAACSGRGCALVLGDTTVTCGAGHVSWVQADTIVWYAGGCAVMWLHQHMGRGLPCCLFLAP